MTITPSTIITAAAFLAALAAIVGYYNKIYKWYQKQNAQDESIKAIKAEQSILVEGVLACLMGLKEQGCDGPVSSAITRIEAHINEQAHK